MKKALIILTVCVFMSCTFGQSDGDLILGSWEITLYTRIVWEFKSDKTLTITTYPDGQEPIVQNTGTWTATDGTLTIRYIGDETDTIIMYEFSEDKKGLSLTNTISGVGITFTLARVE